MWDIIVVGAGTAGLMTGIFAGQRGGRVLMVEAADRIGGTLHLSSGQMSAAGSRLQQDKGIADSWQDHVADMLRINHGTGNRALMELQAQEAATTLHWLMDHGFAPLPEHPVLHYGHEPYTTPRTCWGEGGGLAILEVLRPLIEAEIKAGRVDLRLRTRMTGLEVDDSGAVTGVHVEGPEGQATHRAPSILLTSGGYAASEPMFRRLHGRPRRGWAWDHSHGDGLRLAADRAGAAIVHGDFFLPTFTGCIDIDDPSKTWVTCLTTPQLRPVREMYVNADGARFMAEDEPSVDARERRLMGQPEMSFWAVFDETMYRQARDPLPFILWPEEKFERALAQHPDFVRADSLDELARRTGMKPELLRIAAEGFNRAARGEIRDPMGRQNFEYEIKDPPYYAVKQYGICVVGFAGLDIDTGLRVKRPDGSIIAGLYAAGEITGLGAMGNAYCGGTAVTPALSFGRLAGQKLPLPSIEQAEAAE